MEKLTEMLDFCIKLIAVVTLALMVILVSYNVVLRYFFGMSMPQSEEYARFAFIWTAFMGIIVVERAKQHIQVNIVVERLSGIPAVVVRALREIVIFVTLGLIAYGSVIYTIQVDFRTPASGFPMRLVALSLNVMVFTILGMKFLQLFNDIRSYLRSKKSISTEPEREEIERGTE